MMLLIALVACYSFIAGYIACSGVAAGVPLLLVYIVSMTWPISAPCLWVYYWWRDRHIV